MTSVTDIIARYEALLVQIEAGMTITPLSVMKIDPANLPTWIIRPAVGQGAGVRTRMGAGDYRASRTYMLMLLVEKVPTGVDADQLAAQETARQACYPYLDSVPAFFEARPLLELDDESEGLNPVLDTTPIADDGPDFFTIGADTFSAIPFRQTVTTGHEVIYG